MSLFERYDELQYVLEWLSPVNQLLLRQTSKSLSKLLPPVSVNLREIVAPGCLIPYLESINSMPVSQDLLIATAHWGDLGNFLYLRQKYPDLSLTRDLFSAALEGEDLGILNYLMKENCPVNKWGSYELAAARCGVEVLLYLDSHIFGEQYNGIYLDHGKIFSIIDRRHDSKLDAMNWIKEKITSSKFPQLSTWDFAHSVKNGNLESLKWLRAHRCRCDSDSFEAAIKHYRPEILDWLIEIGCPMDYKAYIAAINGGKLDLLRKIYDPEVPVNHCVLLVAASKVDLATFRWLHPRGSYISSDILNAALKARNIVVAKWLIDEVKILTGETYRLIEESNDLELIKWASRGGHHWESGIISNIIRNGGLLEQAKVLEIVRWLHTNNYQVDRHCYREAVVKGYIDVIYWLDEVGCKAGLNLFLYIIRHLDLKMICWFHSRGLRLCEGVDKEAIERGDTEILDWLLEVGYRFNCRRVGCRRSVLEWMDENL